jgi:hypothetical protein
MRRIKLVVGVCVVMATILALSASSAMANDGRHHQDDNKKHDNNKKFFNDHDDFAFLDLHDDFSDHGFVDFGENDGESALFAGPGCEPPNRLIATWEPDRYVWVWGPQRNLARGYWEGCGREK